MILYPSVAQIERFGCIFVGTFFCFTSSVFHFSLLSLTCDCLVAVFLPLRYRAIVTVQGIAIPNVIILLFMFVILVIYPLIRFSHIDHGYLQSKCSLGDVASLDFQFLMFIITASQNALLIVFNFIIVVKVVVTLTQRKKIAASELSIRKSLMKLSLRLLGIIAFNTGLTLPLTLQLMRIDMFKYASIPFAFAMSVGTLNTMVFFFGDAEILQLICKRKK